METINLKNLTITQRKDGKVEMVFDPKTEIGPTSTGNRMIATTSGNLRVEDLNLSIGLNIYRKTK